MAKIYSRIADVEHIDWVEMHAPRHSAARMFVLECSSIADRTLLEKQESISSLQKRDVCEHTALRPHPSRADLL